MSLREPGSFSRQGHTKAMADSSPPVVLLVGAPGVGKTSTARRLLQDAGAALPSRWRIDTRYYSVDVCLWACPPEAAPDAHRQPEALLLVCSASDEASFEACQRWQQAAGLECEVQLLVVNKWDLVAGEEPSWLPGCLGWCQEQGFELVQVWLWPTVQAPPVVLL